MAPAVLSLGSINADFQLRVERPPDGPGTLAAEGLLRASGGKAANTAVLAARLGATSQLLGCVGDDDLADHALAGPRSHGVDLSLVRRVAGQTGMASILVPPDGDKTIALALGANDAWGGDPDAVTADIAAAPDGSVLVADLEVPPGCVLAAARAARRRGFEVVVDPAPPTRMPAELWPLVSHVAPDHREAEALTGVGASSRDGARRAAEDLVGRGVGTAYVKLSDGGCAVARRGGSSVVEAPDGLAVVDTTGAGDAFTGTLAWALATGHGAEEAGALAVAASACSVGTYGSQASFPSLEELHAMRLRVRRLDPPTPTS